VTRIQEQRIKVAAGGSIVSVFLVSELAHRTLEGPMTLVTKSILAQAGHHLFQTLFSNGPIFQASVSTEFIIDFSHVFIAQRLKPRIPKTLNPPELDFHDYPLQAWALTNFTYHKGHCHGLELRAMIGSFSLSDVPKSL
jgi:hypothetical protein